MSKRPPSWYWIPNSQSNGTCYHAKKCNAHRLTPMPRGQAMQEIRDDDLDPCKNCMVHHDLEPINE